MHSKHPIDRAAEIVGSQTALAELLGVTKGAVSQWKRSERQVPAEHCVSIESATRGRVRCEELRPDVQWGVLRKKRVNVRERAPEEHAEV